MKTPAEEHEAGRRTSGSTPPVRRIPRGRVTTYGAVARLAGLGAHARLVGYALSNLRDGTSGTVAPGHQRRGQALARRVPDRVRWRDAARLRLEAWKAVTVDAAGRVSLTRFGWRVRETARPPDRATRTDSEVCLRTYQRMMKMMTVLKQPPPSFFAP